MRRVAAAAAAGWCLAGAATAAPPQPEARAWLVENPTTGVVLASHAASAEVPIASITKLMTVLVVLDHHTLTDVIRVDRRVTKVGQESVGLREGEMFTVRDLLKATLIQSANDAADALALSVAPDYGAFSFLMNTKARELGLTESHFVRPDGLDAPGEYSSARDATKLARAAMRIPVVRDLVSETADSIPGGRELHTWNDLLGVVPGVFGVKTGHTNDAGWSQVAAARRGGVTVYATILGSPSRVQRDRDLTQLIVWGLGQYRAVDAISTSRAYASVSLPYGLPAVNLVATIPLRVVVRVGRALTERVVAPALVSLPVSQGQVLGRVEIWKGTRLLGSRQLVTSRAVASPSVVAKIRWYATRTLHDALGFFS